MKSTCGRHNFEQEIRKPEAQLDLARAVLYIAQEDCPALDPEVYVRRLDRMAAEVYAKLPAERYPLRVVRTINSYLFDRLKFRGNAENYYDPRNSFLHEVLTCRRGIPITLSLVYLEVARRLQFPMVGIGMPGHFLIRPDIEGVEFFVDAFNGGDILFIQDCQERLQKIFEQPVALTPEMLAPVSKRTFLTRLLGNLKYVYVNAQQLTAALGVVERLLLLEPDSVRERRDRGLLAYQIGRFESAARDLQFYLAQAPEARDARTIRLLLSKL